MLFDVLVLLQQLPPSFSVCLTQLAVVVDDIYSPIAAKSTPSTQSTLRTSQTTTGASRWSIAHWPTPSLCTTASPQVCTAVMSDECSLTHNVRIQGVALEWARQPGGQCARAAPGFPCEVLQRQHHEFVHSLDVCVSTVQLSYSQTSDTRLMSSRRSCGPCLRQSATTTPSSLITPSARSRRLTQTHALMYMIDFKAIM